MKPARSEARNVTAAPISSGWPSRRIGTARSSAPRSLAPSALASAMARSIGVSVGPGHTVLAVTPARATSRAKVLVNAITPPLAPA